MNAITFTVIGEAEAQGSAKNVPLVRRFPTTITSFGQLLRSVAITSDNPKLKRWRKAVAEAAKRALGGVELELAGAVALDVAFYLQAPQHLPKDRGGLPIVRIDLDKACRAICDALSGIAYADDAQVVDLIARKRYAPHGSAPRVDITITPIAIGLPLFPDAERRTDARDRHRPRASRITARESAAHRAWRGDVPW